MQYHIYQKDGFTISTNPLLLNVPYLHHYLSVKSYWAQNIPVEIVQKSIEGSCCFGLYQNEKQIGFARVITDFATYGYLCDVFVDEAFRGLGLSKWMMAVVHEHPQLQGFRNWALGTKDAHGLYEQFGYVMHPEPFRVMRKSNPDVYNNIL